MATRVFTAFDYDHDEFLRTALVGQSKNEDTPFEICDYSVKAPFTGDWTGAPPRPVSLVPYPGARNTFLYLPLTQVYDPATGDCIAHTTPFSCELSVNGPFDGTLSRNTFRQPGAYYQNTAVLKNISLTREGVTLQLRVEFYNVFNHPNLYINGATTDINSSSFHDAEASVPGVTVSLRNSRQIVAAAKIIF